MHAHPTSLAATVALALSTCLAVFSVAEGIADRQLGVAIFLFLPVIYGTGPFAFMTVFFIFLSFVLLFVVISTRGPGTLGSSPYDTYSGDSHNAHEDAHSTEEQHGQERKFGGVIFIGPIPIIFGSSRKMARYMIVIAVIMTALTIAFLLFGLL